MLSLRPLIEPGKIKVHFEADFDAGKLINGGVKPTLLLGTLLVLAPFASAPLNAQAPAAAQPSNGAASKIATAANAFLATLDSAALAKGNFEFNNEEQRLRWSNLPSPMFKRAGLKLGELTPKQREAAMALLASALSPSGYQKVVQIMDADETLKTGAAGKGGPAFGKDEFYISLLGKPSATEPWLLQFGGHHLALNITVMGSEGILTPSHTAAQPAIFTMDGKTIRPLGNENDKAFALINALDESQQKKAILDTKFKDLVLGPGRDGKTIMPEGIKASELNAQQQAMLLDVADEWVGIINDEAAKSKMAELKKNISETWFAWSGPTKNGSAAYFRIQGPTVFIEYAPQQLGGDPTKHIHTMYRDPSNEYGRKLIK